MAKLKPPLIGESDEWLFEKGQATDMFAKDKRLEPTKQQPTTQLRGPACFLCVLRRARKNLCVT